MIQASGEPGLVRPIKEAVEESVKRQIDKSYGVETPSENRQLTGHEGNVPTREETITKISSADFYDDVGRSLLSILEKRAAKKEEKPKDKNNLPPFMKTKGEKEEKDEDEEEEEEEEEGKPKKGKAKKGKKEEDEEEPKFPIFGKKPKKAE